MTWRPKFDSLYTGDWPYTLAQGVGLRLIGKPDEHARCVYILSRYSCPVDLAHRITDDLFRLNARETTVLGHLDFDQLAIDLAHAGVRLEIITPRIPE